MLRLASDPGTCVRFDRHAVYLGQPGPDERCSSQAVGRTEAIRDPAPAGTGAARTLPTASLAEADGPHGTGARIVSRTHRVLITVTWNHDPGIVARALGLRSLAAARAASTVAPPSVTLPQAVRQGPGAKLARHASTAGEVYTGRAFDACSTPSAAQMSAWSSAYRAIGVYIGGVNMACSQANLNSAWVARESTAGWHLIPIYVGLQAPHNQCGCASISAGQASRQGRAAAQDAIAQAQAIGLGAGNPIYYDIEGYATGTTTSSAALGFLGAWTQQRPSMPPATDQASTAATTPASMTWSTATARATPSPTKSGWRTGTARPTRPTRPSPAASGPVRTGSINSRATRTRPTAGDDQHRHRLRRRPPPPPPAAPRRRCRPPAASGSSRATATSTPASERAWWRTDRPRPSRPGPSHPGMAPTPDEEGYWLILLAGVFLRRRRPADRRSPRVRRGSPGPELAASSCRSASTPCWSSRMARG